MSTGGPASPLKSSPAFRWTMGVGVGIMAALGLVLLFLLTQATGNRELIVETIREAPKDVGRDSAKDLVKEANK